MYANTWKESFSCWALEIFMFTGIECSPVFPVYLSFVSYVQISSLIPKPTSMKAHLAKSTTIWVLSILCRVSKTVLWKLHDVNELNYYCIPFQMTQIKDPLLVAFHSCIMIFNVALLGIYIFIQILLIRFLHGHIKATKSYFKSQIESHKVAVRVSILISSNLATWLPIIALQSFVIFAMDLDHSIYFLVLIVTVPINLLINPVLIVLPFLQSLTKE